MTRQYISLKDRSRGKQIYDRMKKIWEDKDVVFIEGEKSRLGVGNDLFANTGSIKRILAPSTQAFNKYDEILKNMEDSYIYDIVKEGEIYTIYIDGDEDSYMIKVKSSHDTEKWEKFMSSVQ